MSPEPPEPPDTPNSSLEKPTAPDAGPEDFFAYRQRSSNNEAEHKESEEGEEKTTEEGEEETTYALRASAPGCIGGIVGAVIFVFTAFPIVLT